MKHYLELHYYDNLSIRALARPYISGDVLHSMCECMADIATVPPNCWEYAECSAGFVKYEERDCGYVVIAPFPSEHNHKLVSSSFAISRGTAKEVTEKANESMKNCQGDGMGPQRVRNETVLDSLREMMKGPGNKYPTYAI